MSTHESDMETRRLDHSSPEAPTDAMADLDDDAWRAILAGGAAIRRAILDEQRADPDTCPTCGARRRA